jgi:hypothetical protein
MSLVGAIYRPDEWNHFFVMVGGAAAVLIGLVFVACHSIPGRSPKTHIATVPSERWPASPLR